MSVKLTDIIDIFSTNEETATLVCSLINGNRDPAPYCQDWLRHCYNRPSESELIMFACNRLLVGCGVEFIPRPTSKYNESDGLSYINVGDCCLPTLAYGGREREYFIGEVSDWLAFVERECLDEVWHDWLRWEFIRVLKTHLHLWDVDDNTDELRTLFDRCCHLANEYPQIESSGYGFTCNVEKLAEVCSIQMLEEFSVTYKLEE